MEKEELILKLFWAVSSLKEEGKAEEAEAVKEAIEIIKNLKERGDIYAKR